MRLHLIIWVGPKCHPECPWEGHKDLGPGNEGQNCSSLPVSGGRAPANTRLGFRPPELVLSPPVCGHLLKEAQERTEFTLATTILTAPAGPEKVQTPLHHTPLVRVGQERPELAAFWSGWLWRGGQHSSLGSSCRGSGPSNLPGSTEAAEFWGLAGAPGNSTQSLLLLGALQ